MTAYTFLAILDFEATCADHANTQGWDPSRQEIIEVPADLVFGQENV